MYTILDMRYLQLWDLVHTYYNFGTFDFQNYNPGTLSFYSEQHHTFEDKNKLKYQLRMFWWANSCVYFDHYHPGSEGVFFAILQFSILVHWVYNIGTKI